MIGCFILLLYAYTISGIGYDAGGGDRASCGRPYRAGRLYQPPCDLSRFGYCVHAGELYPWRAVRRFVKDNQGLMRRMYGDQRHGHVLRAELDDLDELEESWEERERERGGYGHWRPTSIRFAKYQQNAEVDNELDQDLDYGFDQFNEEESRYLRDDLTNDDVLNTKFVISEQEAAVAIKLAELKAAAHFRPVNHRTPFVTQRTPSASAQLPKISTITAMPIIRNITKLLPSNSTIKKGNNVVKFETNEIGGSEETTKWKSTKMPTQTSTVFENTESTLVTGSTSTTEDSLDRFTTDTITHHSSEYSFKKHPTPYSNEALSEATEKAFLIRTTEQPLTDNKLGEFNEVSHDENVKDAEKNNNLDLNVQPIKNSYVNFDDQAAESSENSEVYSESDLNLKQADAGNSPAMLFQDMEEDPSKKKGPSNYNNMKGINACPVKEEVVAPFWANNTRGEVLALLNMYPFEQYVHWEKCTFEHRQMYCRDGCRCEQQYRLHRLLAYDPNNECRGIFSDWFRFPSCCICKCYDMPPEFRVTSRSPRFQMSDSGTNDDN